MLLSLLYKLNTNYVLKKLVYNSIKLLVFNYWLKTVSISPVFGEDFLIFSIK